MNAHSRRPIWVTLLPAILAIFGMQILLALPDSRTKSLMEISVPLLVLVFLLVATKGRIREVIRGRARLLKWAFVILFGCIAGAAIPFMVRFEPHRSFYLMNLLLVLDVGLVLLPFMLINWARTANRPSLRKRV